jgi:hypothetical protein
MGQDSTLNGRLLAGEDESSLQLTLTLLFLMNTVFSRRLVDWNEAMKRYKRLGVPSSLMQQQQQQQEEAKGLCACSPTSVVWIYLGTPRRVVRAYHTEECAFLNLFAKDFSYLIRLSNKAI